MWQGALDTFAPGTEQQNIYVAVPDKPEADQQQSGVIFAEPAVPEINKLAQCRSSTESEQKFWACVVENALPERYRLLASCVSENLEDAVSAYACSTGDEGLLQSVDKFRATKACFEEHGYNSPLTGPCVAQTFMGDKEKLYVGCLTSNYKPTSGLNYAGAVLCALGPQLTAEQQVALDCAATTGGNPKLWAACTGGRLAAAELDKCWSNGIATAGGCFGPNNAFRQWANELKNVAAGTFGSSSVASQVASAYVNNVLAPGPNHEVVKLANNTLNDLKNGPGPNHEINRLTSTMSKGLKSVRRIKIKW